MSNQKTILKTSPEYPQISKWIIHKHSLLDTIEKHIRNHPKEHLTKKDLSKTFRKIKKKHEPLFPDVLNTYNFSVNDIQRGVQCLKCKTIPIPKKENRTIWNCPVCGFISSVAYQCAIADYALLINNTFTNKEMRNFLEINSQSTVYTLLKKMNIQTVGRKHIFSIENIHKFAQKDFIE